MIVGPDGAPWITDGGLNAIVRVDPRTRRVRRFPLPASAGYANLNTATFDRRGVLWFTGQSGIYGRLHPKTAACASSAAPRGAGAVRDHDDASGAVYYASLAGSYLGRIDVRTGKATVLQAADARPGRPPCLVGLARADLDQRVERRRASACTTRATRRWREWRLPGAGADAVRGLRGRLGRRLAERLRRERPRALRPADGAVHPGDAFRRADANVRQIHGRRGEVWGAESGADKLVVVRTGG